MTPSPAHGESATLANVMRVQSQAREANIVLPRVGSSADGIRATIGQLKADGYAAHLVLADLPIENAADRNIKRFRETGRLVPHGYLWGVVADNPRQTYLALRELADTYAYSTDVPAGAAPAYRGGNRDLLAGDAPGAAGGDRAGAGRGDGLDDHPDAATDQRGEEGQAGGGVAGGPFTPRREAYLHDTSDPARAAARNEGEARARLDRLRRAIGRVRREATGRDVAALEAFDAYWTGRERELLDFADRAADRAQRRQAATEAERGEWGERVDAALSDAARGLDIKLRRFFADEMGGAVIESDSQTPRQLLRGSQPGSVTGEPLRAMAQFRSFPVTFTNRVLAREALGYRPQERMLQARNIGVLIAGLVVPGYVAGAVKDDARGFAPADPAEPVTWLRALMQGGGVYGDFLFAQASRFGNSALETLAGPLPGTAASAINLATKPRDGDAKTGKAGLTRAARTSRHSVTSPVGRETFTNTGAAMFASLHRSAIED